MNGRDQIDDFDFVNAVDLVPADDVEAKQVERKRRRIEQEKVEADKFWKEVFSTPAGRREMWAIMDACHTFEERFACGPNGFPQPEATWFHAGEQAIGHRLYETWQIRDYDGVYAMRCENDTRFATAKRQLTARKSKRG